MPRSKPDGLYTRPRSPYWWATLPNGLGGSARRSTRVPVAEDPEGLKAQVVRATWLAHGYTQRTGEWATFDDLMVAYLGQVTPTKRDPQRDRYSAKALFRVFTGRALDSIRGPDVRGYIAKRTADGVQPGTINKEVGLMSAALNWARLDMEWDVDNPWEKRRQKEPAGRARWLTKEEAQALMESANSGQRRSRAPYLSDFIRLGLYTGMRPGEILGLTWDRVSLADRRVTFGVGDQKSGKRGSVPINEEAREALLSRARFRATYCPDSPWVFCDRKGERIANVKKGFAACVRGAGLEDVHPHDLRRTFGSWLVQEGVGIERVSKVLRHHDVSITARVYAHLRPDDLADAVSVLDRNECGLSHRLSHRRIGSHGGKKKPVATG